MTAPATTTTTPTVAARGPILEVGGRGLPWSQAAALDWFGAYELIYCEPGEATEEQQIAFVKALREGVGMLRRWNGRIIWIANEHFSAQVAAEIGCGEPVSLRSLPDGEVLAAFGGVKREVRPCCGLRNLPHAWMPFATWRSRNGTSEITVGAMSADERWIVAPLGITAEDFIVPYEKLQRHLPVVWVFFLIAATLFLGWREYESTASAYDVGVTRIGTVDVQRFIARRETDGNSAADRLLYRILRQRAGALESISEELRFARNPYQLWTDSGSDHRGAAQFQLALASGDLDSAYRIAIADMDDADEQRNWPQLLTATLWQRSLESLLELDFRHAEPYAKLFVQLTDVHSRNASDREALEPERNRTLARILSRELQSPRIYSLCAEPEKARHFGRLLGGGWGEPLAPTTPALTALRATNFEAQCKGKPVAAFDYSELETLETIDENTDLATLPVCTIAAVECAFLKQRASLLAWETKRYEGRDAPSPAPAALEFAAVCSYLSDDLLGMLVNITRPDTVEHGLRIDAGALVRALACVDERADYHSLVVDGLEEFPCTALTGDKAALRSAHLGRLAERCGR